ncbi:Gfo/Idh/MocA family protein [Domibacillus enclensis]|uniref:Oxidoreductase n=1 Tax=Domibacillus enclensis TaxID=1017273 RepID=A0A1N6SBV3_9BACI|nr:Gfo/Idh/MocA family oxidoreductase [Domibacillus enclensis]OXS79280.1 oxidoreductase [Domibacillus enclensis]SIQ38633.1 Predicted dehydrogenase [Domibacillus enclensis]
MNVLVIGYGSIGKRHESILRLLGCFTEVVSRHKKNNGIFHENIHEALRNGNYDYLIIANETKDHEETLNYLVNQQNKKILVEKPIFSHLPQRELYFPNLYVGYNLRFHPVIQALHHQLLNEPVISVQAYVGQYLPSWRPGSDYTKSYSASVDKGGGVLRDLSHELDYLQFLFGEWNELTASGGKFSDLKIESDDHFSVLYRTSKVPLISVQVNYLDFITQRFVIVNTDKHTYKADLVNNTLKKNEQIQKFYVNRDDTYRAQHVAVLNGEREFLCTYEEGLRVVKMIEACEKASKEKVWLYNE